MEFKKMGIIKYGPDQVLNEPMVTNVNSFDGKGGNKEVQNTIKNVQAYIKKHKLDMCCIARILGSSNLDSVLSRIIVFGDDGSFK